MTAPPLSVVLIVRHPEDDPAAVLEALGRQEGRGEAEVLLVDGRPAGQGGAGADAVLFRPGAPMPRLKAEGALAAQGGIVAFLEPKAVPEPGWIAAIGAAFGRRPRQSLGGPVLLAGPRRAADMAAYTFEYAAFAADRVAAGGGADLPGNNMAMPRAELLASCGDVLARDGLNKPFVQARLVAAGLPVVLDPAMAVRMKTAHRLGPLLSSRFRYARCFGGTRMAHATRRQRALYRLGVPAVAPLLLGRHLGALRRSGELGPGAACALAALCLSWAAGEALGTWLGPGRACEFLY